MAGADDMYPDLTAQMLGLQEPPGDGVQQITQRHDHALNFVAGQASLGRNVSKVDSDLAAWLLMHSDLFPNRTSVRMPDSLSEDTDNEIAAAANAHPELLVSGAAAGEPPVPLVATSTTGSSPPDAGDLGDAALSVGGSDSESESERRQRRLEKNRVIARNSRKRKRQRMQQLEEEVVALRAANERLMTRVKQDQDTAKREQTRVEALARIEAMVARNCEGADIADAIAKYKDLFSDFGQDRKQAVKYHLEQLKMLLLPTQVTKMCMWSLHQEDEFYDETKSDPAKGGGIWNILCSELNITDEQKMQILNLRHSIRQQRRSLAGSLKMLSDLEKQVDRGIDSLASEMSRLMTIVTPAQQAKFLVWIEKNQACMYMLNNLWAAEREEEAAAAEAATPGLGGVSAPAPPPPVAVAPVVSPTAMPVSAAAMAPMMPWPYWQAPIGYTFTPVPAAAPAAPRQRAVKPRPPMVGAAAGAPALGALHGLSPQPAAPPVHPSPHPHMILPNVHTPTFPQ